MSFKKNNYFHCLVSDASNMAIDKGSYHSISCCTIFFLYDLQYTKQIVTYEFISLSIYIDNAVSFKLLIREESKQIYIHILIIL